MMNILTMGEALYRLTPPHFQRIEQVNQLDFFVGGSELNTAIGLSRLGLNVTWYSRLTDNALGRRIDQALRGQGVDTTSVTWTPDDRIGLYFMEEGVPPRDSQVIYDRANSAFSRIQPDDVPDGLIPSANLHLFHVTGISLAVSDSAAKTTATVWESARQAGALLSFDVNHRRKLWSEDASRVGCEPFMKTASIIFIAQRDAETVFGKQGTPESILQQLHVDYPQATVVMTQGAQGASACDSAGTVVHQATFPAQPVGRVGGGDSFSAGFLYGLLTENDLALACRWGAAVAALKYTTPGDITLIDRQSAYHLVHATQGGGGLVR